MEPTEEEEEEEEERLKMEKREKIRHNSGEGGEEDHLQANSTANQTIHAQHVDHYGPWVSNQANLPIP
jgi:hypothetical protein